MKRNTLLLIMIAIITIFTACQDDYRENTTSSVTDVAENYSDTDEELSMTVSLATSSTVIDDNSSEASDDSYSEMSDDSYSEESDSYESESSLESSYPSLDENISAYPLLFIDTTDWMSDKAYVIGAFNELVLYSTHEFSYNGKHLLEYMDEYGSVVESNIIDTSKDFAFRDKHGNAFNADCGQLSCYGEEIIEEVHVCVDVTTDIPTDSRRFLGTYSGVDIFPEALEYGDNSVTTDLDCDGDNEIIRWSFEKDEERSGDDSYYFYTLEAVIDGKTVFVSDNYDWVSTKRSDFEIFIADVDMDGNYEVIVYIKAASRFNNIFIYKVISDKCELIHSYAITPEP